MVDLQSQYKNIKSQVKEEIDKVLDSSMYINGPVVKEFQADLEKYLNVKHVIPCANGTDALQIALMALDLKPGDEIITSDFTFAATVEVVKLLKLEAVLVDVDKDSYNISIDSVRKAITPKTKAIIPVHIFGQCSNMDAVMELAEEHNLYVIEDTAQAIGAEYHSKNAGSKKAGTIGDIGTTSFFPSKNLGGYGDGGAIFTNNDDYAAVMRSIVNHGMGKRYYYDRVGVNSRLDSMQAAVLKVKLQYLDHYIAARQKAADYYDNYFKDMDQVQTPKRVDDSSHVFHQYTLVIDGLDQFALQEELKAKGIPAMIYYPLPLHTQKAYDAEKYNDEDFKATNYLCKNVISLPMHTELDDDQLAFICESVKTFLQK